MERKPRLTLRDARRLHTTAAGSGGTSSNPNARAYRIARQTGHLNLSTRSLAAFPREILRLHELAEEDERSWESAVLQKVDLSYNEITELPAEIQELAYVSSFKMRHNQLRQLPEANLLEGVLSEGLSRLVNLRDLALDGNKLTQLPDSLHVLENLEALKLENNQLRSLPPQIGKLRRLHTLTAHSNQLTALPESLGLLSNLSTLDLHKNSLASVGDSFVRLASLRFLDLHQNRLEVFPELPHESALDQLMLGFNLLRAVSDSSVLRAKDTLTVLDMRDNRLARLPDTVAHLHRLKTLDLTNNDLHELPAGLGYLKDLHHLMVEGNPLRTIRRAVISGGSEVLKKYLRTRGGPPAGVEALEEEFDEFALRDKQQQQQRGGSPLGAAAAAESLATQHEYLFRDAASSGSLQLVGMGLFALPSHLQGFGKYNFAASLTQLNLSKNKLGRLPKEIGELAALQTLVAEECALTQLHPSLANLAQLQHLRLRKNLLPASAVDAMIASDSQAGMCGSLRELDLGHNVLTSVPAKLTLLQSLDTLLLPFNRIVSLDAFDWASLPRLSILALSDNQLESLGTVYEATMLTSLSIENNNLRQIPPELGRCEHLRALVLGGNPQRSVRVNTIQEGTEAVLKYLRNRLPLHSQSAPARSSVASSVTTEADTENIPPPNRAAAVGQLRDTSEAKRPRTTASEPSAGASRAASSLPQPRAVASLSSAQLQQQQQQPPGGSADSSSHALLDLDKKIAALEATLEDFALTAAKKFAVKKELAMVRSQKIRLLRAAQP
ncbi:hypothetical protein PybrP1_008725 [[Pythium] brassicae (nom. inval.)]|nr:hypothetical protein PybrP1_008725 [[Pythium] brassicae (nom. inval.)]